MANYSVLKAAVQAVVKTNGNQEITGANMQSTLISIINSLGTGYQFMGVATPSTSPGTPDYNVAYIGGAGTYANFGTSITIPVGSIGVFKYNGSWTKEQVKMFEGIDDVPTVNSNNLVKSGGVADEVSQLWAELDPTKMPLFAGYLASNNTYTSPSIASSYFFPVPAGGDYSILVGADTSTVIYAFVKSIPTQTEETADYATGSQRQTLETNGEISGNIPSDAAYLYVSNIINGNSWFPKSIIINGYDYVQGVVNQLASVSEKVSDLSEEYTEIYDKIAPISEYIKGNFLLSSNNIFYTGAAYECVFFPIKSGDVYSFAAEAGGGSVVALLKSLPEGDGSAADYATGTGRTVGGSVSHTIPSDAKYMYVLLKNGNTSFMPSVLTINGYDYILGVNGSIAELAKYKGVTDSDEANSIIKWFYQINDSVNLSNVRIAAFRKGYAVGGVSTYGLYLYEETGAAAIETINLLNPSPAPTGETVIIAGGACVCIDFSKIDGTIKEVPLRFNLSNILTANSFLVHEHLAKREVNIIRPTIIEHYFINNNGVKVGNGTTTTGNMTEPVPVKAGTIVTASCMAGSTMAVITECNSSGNNRSVLVVGNDKSQEYNYTFDHDTFVIVSYTSPGSGMKLFTAEDERIGNLHKTINDIVPIVNSLKLTNNNDINEIVKSLYIPSSAVSAEELANVSQFRIYNGFGGFYGVALYDSSNNVIQYVRSTSADKIIEVDGCYTEVDFSKVSDTYQHFTNIVLNIDKIENLENQAGLYAEINSKRIGILAKDDTYFKELGVSPIMNYEERPILYVGDTKANTNHIVNAVMYPNGVIIAARVGSVVRINLDGTEETLLSINGASDWRGLFLDKDNNVYASPHASLASPGGFQMSDRGLYRLAYGQNSFVKVISLYNPSSDVPSEREQNDDTIWTMCQDREGNLYAGVYSHTVRYNPSIYKSTNGGTSWAKVYDFISAGTATNGHHIHSIIYNQYNNALYAIVGEINTVFKSTDGSATWENLNAVCEGDKGSSMVAVKDGVIIGSDGAFSCQISKLLADDKTVITKASVWANTVFAIRRSDITGWLYAFTKIDSSVNSTTYMPPIEALTSEAALNAWIESAPSQLANWQKYNNRVKNYYPDDSIRPQHCGILISKDDGETWEVLYYKYVTSTGASGFVTTGYFRNGECLTGFFEDTGGGMSVVNPIIISEGKHKYEINGINLNGEILIRTNTSDNITPI